METMTTSMTEEAVRRMKELGIVGNVIKEFTHGVLEYSESTPLGGILYWVSNEPVWEKAIKDFEEETGNKVYHAIHTYTNFGELLSLLFVSNPEEIEEDEWDYELEKQDDGTYYAFSYVMNLSDPLFSEYGTIGIKPASGGVVRVF